MSTAFLPENRFTVVCQQSGLTVQVPPGTSILDALMDAGLLPDHSCQNGVCGACETRVISCDGALDHRDDILTQDERARGETMMICVSRCAGARLVLDI